MNVHLKYPHIDYYSVQQSIWQTRERERERAFNSESLCVVTKNFTTLRVSIGDNNRLNGWQASAINLWALQRSYEIPSSDPATLILLFWHAKANWKFKSL